MAFQKLNTQGEAIHIKKGTVVTGYLNGCRIIPAKKKGDRPSVLFLMQGKDKSPIEVWANGVLKHALLNEEANGIKPELRGVMFRFTGTNKVKLDKGRAPMQGTDIEMDTADTIKATGKDYVLNRNKKFAKK